MSNIEQQICFLDSLLSIDSFYRNWCFLWKCDFYKINQYKFAPKSKSCWNLLESKSVFSKRQKLLNVAEHNLFKPNDEQNYITLEYILISNFCVAWSATKKLWKIVLFTFHFFLEILKYSNILKPLELWMDE